MFNWVISFFSLFYQLTVNLFEMKLFTLFTATYFFIAFISNEYCIATNNMESHLQLLVITTENWEEKSGYMRLFEKASQDEQWILMGAPIPVVVGKSGMAWGIGLNDLISNQSFIKSEGDLRSPAGIFSLGPVFGFLPRSQMAHLKMDYLELNEFIEAVDDPLSNFYNCIVDSREVISDWNSSEKMREEPLYEIGLVINHNFPQPKPGKGSAIFFHRWRNRNAGTAGCTAMSQDNLEKLISWLEKSKNPALIQLPYPIYSQLQCTWNLPTFINEINSTY